MNDYKKIAQLPVGLDVQQNLLLAGDASGYNWLIADGAEFRKRPGLRPVIAQPEPDATAGAYTSSLNAPKGVLCAAEYVVGNQLRQKSYEKLTGSTDTVKIYADTQLVFVCDGRLFTIRKMPVLVLAGATYSYRFGTNPTTGALEFGLRNLSSGAETVTTVTSSTTLGSLSNVTVLDVTYTKAWPTSQMPGLSGMPASCIVRTDGGQWLNLDPTNNFIYGYVPFEVPFSNPTSDNTVYRCFYAQDTAARDGNVMGVQFQDEMLFAGRGDALMSFDGYRMSVAGCVQITSASGTVVVGAGLLSAGTYNYLLRPVITKPSGQVSYGPPTTFTRTLVGLNDAVDITMTYSGDLSSKGSSYSGVAYSPRRYNSIQHVYNALINRVDTTVQELARTKLQVGESLSWIDDTNGIPGRGLVYDITGTAISVQSEVADTRDLRLSFGEEVEVYRTTVGGSAYYHIATIPARETYRDATMPDASLTAQPSYLAKPYVIQRPPDHCVAVVPHQNRIVVVGEYENTWDPLNTAVTTLDTAAVRPFIKSVYWSQPNNEEFSPTNNAILDVTEGGELNSCISTGDMLYVGGGESMWAIQGSLASASAFTVNRIAGAGGTVGNTAITALNGQVFAVSKVGLYALVGGAADYTIGLPINPLIRQVRPELQPFIRLVALKKTGGLALVLPGMVFERAAVKLAAGDEVFPGTAVATENAADTIALVFDPHTEKWSRWQGEEMYMGGGLVEHDGLTWAFPRKQGKPISVLDSNYGYDGFTTPVEMSIKGPWQTDGDIFTDKSFVRLRVICAAPGRQNFVLRTKIERNWNENQAWQEADMGFRDGAGYGQLPYGVYPYGDPNEVAQQLPMTNQKALSVRAVIENSDPAEFPSITGWNFEVAENRKNMKQE